MDEISQKFEDLANKMPDYESDICDAINCLERATFTGVDKGKAQLDIAKKRLKEMDDLIAQTLLLIPLSDEVNDRLMQCFVSFRPRLESFIEQLEALIKNPPKESLFPPIDDSEIFPSEKENNDENTEIVKNNDDNTKNLNIESQMDQNNELITQDTKNQANLFHGDDNDSSSPVQSTDNKINKD